MDTTIRVDGAVTTLVTVFTVELDNQPKTLALLKERVETLFSTMPGWISSNLSRAGTGVGSSSIRIGETPRTSRRFVRTLG